MPEIKIFIENTDFSSSRRGESFLLLSKTVPLNSGHCLCRSCPKFISYLLVVYTKNLQRQNSAVFWVQIHPISVWFLNKNAPKIKKNKTKQKKNKKKTVFNECVKSHLLNKPRSYGVAALSCNDQFVPSLKRLVPKGVVVSDKLNIFHLLFTMKKHE